MRTPFEIYPKIVVPPGSYKHEEAELVLMTNQSAPASLELRTISAGSSAAAGSNSTRRYECASAMP